jgi:uncharacterized membrane protein
MKHMDRIVYHLSRNWVFVFSLLLGIFVVLPFLAPIFMHLGWQTPAKAIYSIYSVLCHQLPQRSFFLFGSQTMYSLAEIQEVWQNTDNAFILRQFIGNPEMGWKVAWSDRMVTMYASPLLIGWLWWLGRERIKPLPWWGLVMFLFPMALDGTSHFISDLSGIGQGFRESNAWLAVLTGNAFPDSFYAGEALGSFNSWMRLLTGILFGLGLVWFGFPFMHKSFNPPAQSLRPVVDDRGSYYNLPHSSSNLKENT